MDSNLPSASRRPEMILLALALIAGALGSAVFWMTTFWKISMPWNHGMTVPDHFGLACTVLLLLAVAGAWIRHAVAGPRAWLLLVIAAVLCFTGSAALSTHGIQFDPLSAALSLLLGGALTSWWNGRATGPPRTRPKPATAKTAEPEMLMLAEDLAEPSPVFAERPVFILTCCLKDTAPLRKKLGPFEFLKLTSEFRRLTNALLETRRALVLPGSGETVQACFGFPVAGDDDGPWAAETARLLAFALKDFTPTETSGTLPCGFSLLRGLVNTGMGETAHEVSGALLETARIAAEQAPADFIARDATTAVWLPEPEPEAAPPSVSKKTVTPRKKPAARKAKPASDAPTNTIPAKKRVPSKSKSGGAKGSKKKPSEEN